ncbi:MAG: Nif3-like dinuclear metal center hexameric protein [Bacillota bacterium]
MQATVKNVTSRLEKLAPLSIAMPGDPVGLQIGSNAAEVKKILVALDPDHAAVSEALSIGAELLLTHHPLFYQKISSVNEDLPGGAIVAEAIRNRLNIYSAHTNYDIAPEGVTFQLAKRLGLPAENARVLEVTGSEQLLKFVVFVPVGHEDAVRSAIAAAGAGQTGNYSHCTFQVAGCGTFMPGEGTNPYIGSSGQLEKADELRMETILPATRRTAVIKAMVNAHPYEEVAYDLYPLDLEGKAIGLGLIIDLEETVGVEEIVRLCRERINANCLRYWTGSQDRFKRIAICGGSGGSLIDHALQKGADIFISGDFRYHDLKNAESSNLALIDAGHDATEWPGMIYLQQYLEKMLQGEGYKTEVSLQASGAAKWNG